MRGELSTLQIFCQAAFLTSLGNATRYAQRMLIENALCGAVRFFHMDALSSRVEGGLRLGALGRRQWPVPLGRHIKDDVPVHVLALMDRDIAKTLGLSQQFGQRCVDHADPARCCKGDGHVQWFRLTGR